MRKAKEILEDLNKFTEDFDADSEGKIDIKDVPEEVKKLFNELRNTSLKVKGITYSLEYLITPENEEENYWDVKRKYDYDAFYLNPEKPSIAYSIEWFRKNPDKLRLQKIVNHTWSEAFIDVTTDIKVIEQVFNNFKKHEE